MTGEELWDRIAYFLGKVVPVATEAKVRLSCHPNDPPMPDKNRWNVDQVLDSVAGLKKFVKTHESPYHGLLMPDHTPSHADDPGGRQHFAWAYGYIKGIIEAVYATT